jgi:hypothetical protein
MLSQTHPTSRFRRENPFVGALDLGKYSDYAAAIVLQRDYESVPPGKSPILAFVEIQRWPLRTRYTDIVDDVREIDLEIKKKGAIVNYRDGRPSNLGRFEDAAWIVDEGGPGAGVIEILEERTSIDPIKITTTNSDKSRPLKGRKRHSCSVPQAVGLFNRANEDGRIEFASGMEEETAILFAEMDVFRRKLTEHRSITYHHERATDHDDLVMAALYAVWWAEGGGKPPTVQVVKKPAGF